MLETSRRFKICWMEFQKFYKSTQIWPFPAGKGTPSDVIWGEHDIVLHLARFCGAQFGMEWIHIEVASVGGSRIDLVITNPEPWMRAVREQKPLKIGQDVTLDLTVEVAIVAGHHSQYNVEKVQRDASKLELLVENRNASSAALCILQKDTSATDMTYDSIKREFPRVQFFHVSDQDIRRSVARD